jgi:hypothetical protein
MIDIPILIAYIVVLIMFLITSLLKAAYHFAYLKEIFPEKYGMYRSYFAAFFISQYNVKLQFLFFPFFKRYNDNNNPHIKSIVRRVKQYKFCSLFCLSLLLLPIVIGVLKR